MVRIGQFEGEISGSLARAQSAGAVVVSRALLRRNSTAGSFPAASTFSFHSCWALSFRQRAYRSTAPGPGLTGERPAAQVTRLRSHSATQSLGYARFALLTEPCVTVPLTTRIVDVPIRGHHQRDAARSLLSETPFAPPAVARTIQVTVLWNLNRRA